MTFALAWRRRPMAPAAKHATASRIITHAGYAPTLAEKKPLITSEKPLVTGTSLGYVSSSRTTHATIVQKMTQFRNRRGTSGGASVPSIRRVLMPAPLGRGSST